MERSLERMAQRRQRNATRPTSPVPMTPDAPAPTGTMSARLADIPGGPETARKAVANVAGRMFWAAQSPTITEAQRGQIMDARATVLAEAAVS